MIGLQANTMAVAARLDDADVLPVSRTEILRMENKQHKIVTRQAGIQNIFL